MVSVKQGEVNIEELKLLYKTNDTARAFLDYAARRERNAKITPVERIQAYLAADGHEASRPQIVHLLKELARIGCGKFFVGRRDCKSRLEWTVGMASVGRAASGQSQNIEKAPDEQDLFDETVRRLRHTYHLRPEVSVEFDLPADLTESEANRLADYLKTLPFKR